MQVTLIHNPSAGSESEYDAEHLRSLLRKAGHDVRYRSSHECKWAEALQEPADLVAVAGGDGTVASVAKKLIGRHIPIAPLPLGTANNIARTLHLTDLPLQEIIGGWKLDHYVTFDAGLAKGPWGSRYFVEGFGVGLFARTLVATAKDKGIEQLSTAKEKMVHARELMCRVLEDHPPLRLKMILDGEDLSGEYVMVSVMNVEYLGPNLLLAPDIRPADGLFDVILVRSDEHGKLMNMLASLCASGSSTERLRRIRAQRIELEWSGYKIYFDDIVWPEEDEQIKKHSSRITVSVVTDALTFLCAR